MRGLLKVLMGIVIVCGGFVGAITKEDFSRLLAEESGLGYENVIHFITSSSTHSFLEEHDGSVRFVKDYCFAPSDKRRIHLVFVEPDSDPTVCGPLLDLYKCFKLVPDVCHENYRSPYVHYVTSSLQEADLRASFKKLFNKESDERALPSLLRQIEDFIAEQGPFDLTPLPGTPLVVGGIGLPVVPPPALSAPLADRLGMLASETLPPFSDLFATAGAADAGGGSGASCTARTAHEYADNDADDDIDDAEDDDTQDDDDDDYLPRGGARRDCSRKSVPAGVVSSVVDQRPDGHISAVGGRVTKKEKSTLPGTNTKNIEPMARAMTKAGTQLARIFATKFGPSNALVNELKCMTVLDAEICAATTSRGASIYSHRPKVDRELVIIPPCFFDGLTLLRGEFGNVFFKVDTVREKKAKGPIAYRRFCQRFAAQFLPESRRMCYRHLVIMKSGDEENDKQLHELFCELIRATIGLKNYSEPCIYWIAHDFSEIQGRYCVSPTGDHDDTYSCEPDIDAVVSAIQEERERLIGHKVAAMKTKSLSAVHPKRACFRVHDFRVTFESVGGGSAVGSAASKKRLLEYCRPDVCADEDGGEGAGGAGGGSSRRDRAEKRNRRMGGDDEVDAASLGLSLLDAVRIELQSKGLSVVTVDYQEPLRESDFNPARKNAIVIPYSRLKACIKKSCEDAVAPLLPIIHRFAPAIFVVVDLDRDESDAHLLREVVEVFEKVGASGVSIERLEDLSRHRFG